MNCTTIYAIVQCWQDKRCCHFVRRKREKRVDLELRIWRHLIWPAPDRKKKGALHQQHNIGQIVKKGPNGDADCEDLKTFHSNKFFFSFHVLWGCSKCQLFRKWSPPLFGCVKWPSGRRTKKVMTHHFVLDFCNGLQDPTGHGLLEHEMESLFFLVLRFGRMWNRNLWSLIFLFENALQGCQLCLPAVGVHHYPGI